MISKFLKINKIIIILISLFYINPKGSFLIKKETLIESNNYQIFEEIKQNSKEIRTSQILKEINIIKHLSVLNTEKYKKRKNIIHITVSVNNNIDYKYILLVSIYSLFSINEFQQKKNIYNISFIMFSRFRYNIY